MQLEDCQTWRTLARYIGHSALRAYGPYAAVEKSSGELVGSVGLWSPGQPGEALFSALDVLQIEKSQIRVAIDWADRTGYKRSVLGDRESGGNPLLPRNCKRQDESKDIATGRDIWEGSSNPLKRKSGDRPRACQIAFVDFDGRVEERRSQPFVLLGTAPIKFPLDRPRDKMRQGCPHEVTLVLGGARSGKSRFAQSMASGHESVVFIATATASDAEMEQRIERHRRSRPPEWQTLEVPLDLDATISSLQDDAQLAIVDCLTLYLANVMGHAQNRIPDIEEHLRRLCAALKSARVPVVVVSNEVGSGVHATTPSGRLYSDLLGELNQQVGSLAQNVIVMMAGIPVAIKGRLPAHVPSGLGFKPSVLQPGV